jgi:hypothetical protein
MAGTTTATEHATIVAARPHALRDYFLRLGATASILESGNVQVELAVASGDETIADHLQHWVARNQVAAELEGAAPAPVRATPLQPATDLFSNAPRRPRLGDLLTSRGLLTAEQLEEALAESNATRELLGRVLIRRGFIFDDELARTLADQLDLPYVNLRVAGLDRSVATMVPSREGFRAAALPIGVIGGRIRVAFADPSDEDAAERLRPYVGDFTRVVAELSEIELAWRSIDPNCAAA